MAADYMHAPLYGSLVTSHGSLVSMCDSLSSLRTTRSLSLEHARLAFYLMANHDPHCITHVSLVTTAAHSRHAP